MRHYMTETKKPLATMLLNRKVKSDVFGSPHLRYQNIVFMTFPKLLTVNKVSLLTFKLIFCVSVHCHNLIAVFIANISQNKL